MPDWRIHSEFDPCLGSQMLRIGHSPSGNSIRAARRVLGSPRSANSQTVEIFVRPLVHAVINTIERRYAENVHLPATKVWPNAVEQIRRVSWESPSDEHIALFFHSSVNPVELYADAVCHQAGAGRFTEWEACTWKSLQACFESLMQRPLRFLVGADQAAIRHAKLESYVVVQVRP